MADESEVAKALVGKPHWMTGFPEYDRTLGQQPGMEPRPPGYWGGGSLFGLPAGLILSLARNQMGVPQREGSIGASVFPGEKK